MKITLNYRNPTPVHCDVAVFIDGALTGVLTLLQRDILTFQHLLSAGMTMPGDAFKSTGNPDYGTGFDTLPDDSYEAPHG